jgi:hypothetical protein
MGSNLIEVLSRHLTEETEKNHENQLPMYLPRFERESLEYSSRSLPLKQRVRLGRAIAQEVSRRLPTAAARVQTRVWSCGIL